MKPKFSNQAARIIFLVGIAILLAATLVGIIMLGTDSASVTKVLIIAISCGIGGYVVGMGSTLMD